MNCSAELHDHAVYNTIAVFSLLSSHVSLQVSFDDLPSHQSKKPQELVEFWKMTKRLQHGTLVQLWTETPSTETDAAPESVNIKIISCVISEREEQLLAPRQHNRRPTIGLRLYVIVCTG